MYDYARMSPFITAYARSKVSKLVENYKDDVIRVHTDSITVPASTKLEVSNKIGKLKIEYEGKAIVESRCKLNKLELFKEKYSRTV